MAAGKLERAKEDIFQRGLDVIDLADKLMKDQADLIESQSETIRVLTDTIRRQSELIEQWRALLEVRI